MISKFSRNFTCRGCDGNIGEAVEQEEKLCDEMETLRKLSYLGDRLSAGGGCEAARTRCEWVAFSELLYGRRFPLWLKGAAYKSYAWSALLYGSDAWCLKESYILCSTFHMDMHKMMYFTNYSHAIFCCVI